MGKRGDKRKKKQLDHERAQAHRRKSLEPLESTMSADPEPDSRNKRSRSGTAVSWLLRAVLFFAGVIATIVFQTVFVHALPRAGFWVDVREWPASYDQCQLYVTLIKNDEPIEQFNVKLPMPVVVDSYFVGVSEETVIDDKFQLVSKVDRDRDGKCTIEDISRNNYLNLTASAAGATLSIQGSNMPRNTFAQAWVVGRAGRIPQGVDNLPRSTNPSTATGQYSYLKLGQLVTKAVPISYSKWGNPAPWKKK